MEWYGTSVSEMAAPKPGIQTFSKAVDELFCCRDPYTPGPLGTGVPLGMLTEFYGVSGIGKTHMAMQLSLCVQICSELGGCGSGGAVYVDTEGGFNVNRLHTMAQAMDRHMTRVIDRKGGKWDVGAQALMKQSCSTPALLSNVTLLRAPTLGALTEAITRVVPDLAAAREKSSNPLQLPIKLLVLDSLAFLLRGAPDTDAGDRVREMTSLGSHLAKLAERFHLAVVVTNHAVSSREGLVGGGSATVSASAGGGGGGESATLAASLSAAVASSLPGTGAARATLDVLLDPDASKLIPALGDPWAHFLALRVSLQWERGKRVAVMSKSLLAEGATAAQCGGEPPCATIPFPGVGLKDGTGLLPPAVFEIQDDGIRGEGSKKHRA